MQTEAMDRRASLAMTGSKGMDRRASLAMTDAKAMSSVVNAQPVR